MKRIIALSLMTAYVQAAADCWAKEYGYNCCSDNIVPASNTYNDTVKGFWGVENGDWCGIKKRDYCWAKAKGFKCCSEKVKTIDSVDMDGIWGTERGDWCGFIESVSLWNDREKFDDTKNEWNNFKTKWDKEYKDNFERLSVFVGEDESKLNFGWYSTTTNTPSIIFGTAKDMSDAETFDGTNEYYKTLKGVKYYVNKVTVSNLKRNSVYYYQRVLNGKKEEVVQFKTYDPLNFSFIFMGDPQIGGSNDRVSVLNKEKTLTIPEAIRNDAFNWNVTINKSIKFARTPSVLLSAGDQTDTECYDAEEKELIYQENEYSAFLLPELMKQIPTAVSVCNHDAYTENFRHHFNMPNEHKTDTSRIKNYKDFLPAHNYYFKYNNALVVVLETNFHSCEDFGETIKEAIKKYPTVDWRIAMFHHDIYSNGKTHSDEHFIKDTLRGCLTELFDKNDFDLVINGHDHVYTISHFVSYDNNRKGYSVTPLKRGEIQKDPKGTLYVTANCSSGSKFKTFDSKERDYLYYYEQPYTASFGVVEFKAEYGKKIQLVVNTYSVDTNKLLDGPYILEKTSKCWSYQQGFPCCASTTEVYSTDENGSWGIENGSWCGIFDGNTSTNTKTSSSTRSSSRTSSSTSASSTRSRTRSSAATSSTSTRTRTRTTTTTTRQSRPTNCAEIYGQCGGDQTYTGPTCCSSGQCVKYNDYYSQCVP